MGGYIIRRIALMVPTLLIVSLFIFFVVRIMPGDVAMLMLQGPEGDGAIDPDQYQALRDRLGLDEPLPVQYVHWMGDLLVGRGGESLWTGEPVYDELVRRMPLTLQLAFGAIVVGHVIAIPAGVISALKRNTPTDYIVRVIAVLGTAVPSFWLGVLLIMLLIYVFSWNIPLGYVNVHEDPWRNFQQLVFPVLVLGTALSATVARMTRATILEVLREDYVRTARAKGLHERNVIMRHVLRNSLLPVMTLSALQLGALISGTVIIEQVFTLPGVGRFLVDSIFRHDYIVVQGVVFLFALAYMVVNLMTDILYAIVDPRIRFG